MNTIVKLDTRGRLVIPSEFRTPLGLKEGDDVLLSIDYKTDTLTVIPIISEPKSLFKIEIEFGDQLGCLAKTAFKLAELGVDFVQTESKSSQRGKRARWDIYADMSRSKVSSNQLKQELMSSGYVDSVTIMSVAREGVKGGRK
jgi:AbrB family looped-hinge helix DNA binding protein